VSEIASSPDTRLRAVAAVVAATVVAVDAAHFGLGTKAAVAAFLSVALVALAATDVATRRIPNAIVLPAAAVVLAGRLAFGHGTFWEWPAAGVAAAAFLLVAAVVSGGGVGMGDVKLALLLGFGLGRATLVAFLIGFGVAAIYSVAVLVRRGLGARRASFALGPFLAFGGCVAVLVT
jgi:prepilin signal peptidase PulO-like enzyme (type II secretory pathway)